MIRRSPLSVMLRTLLAIPSMTKSPARSTLYRQAGRTMVSGRSSPSNRSRLSNSGDIPIPNTLQNIPRQILVLYDRSDHMSHVLRIDDYYSFYP
jgi:hypothetical protein